MEVIAVVNHKGGVGKTTTTHNIGAALAREGRKVLLIDADMQGSLSAAAGMKAAPTDPTLFEVIMQKLRIRDAIFTRESEFPYDLIKADTRLSNADVLLSNVKGRDSLLKAALKPIRSKYDYVLIDCAPSINTVTLMSLTACDSVIIPITALYLSLDGLNSILNTIGKVKSGLNPDIFIHGVIITMYDRRRSLDRGVVKAVRKQFPNALFDTMIKFNVKLAEAPKDGKDIFEYAPKSHGADAYREIARELIERS